MARALDRRSRPFLPAQRRVEQFARNRGRKLDLLARDQHCLYGPHGHRGADRFPTCSQAADVEKIAASNTYGASLVEAYPKRFGFLAQLPMTDPARAVAEIRRGIEELGAEGFTVLSNRGGIYLGDPRYEPVWAELDRDEATLFIHPTTRGFDATRLGAMAD